MALLRKNLLLAILFIATATTFLVVELNGQRVADANEETLKAAIYTYMAKAIDAQAASLLATGHYATTDELHHRYALDRVTFLTFEVLWATERDYCMRVGKDEMWLYDYPGAEGELNVPCRQDDSVES
jgi:hypothetical protein